MIDKENNRYTKEENGFTSNFMSQYHSPNNGTIADSVVNLDFANLLKTVEQKDYSRSTIPNKLRNRDSVADQVSENTDNNFIKRKSTMQIDFRFSLAKEDQSNKETGKQCFTNYLKFSFDQEVQAQINSIKLPDEKFEENEIYCDLYKISQINDMRYRFEVTEVDGSEYNKLQKILGDQQFYRKCLGDGNCFFRAFMFVYFENLILLKKVAEMEYFINFLYKNYYVEFTPNNYEIDRDSMATKLLRLLNLMKSNTDQAYKLLISLFNSNKDFDLVVA